MVVKYIEFVVLEHYILRFIVFVLVRYREVTFLLKMECLKCPFQTVGKGITGYTRLGSLEGVFLERHVMPLILPRMFLVNGGQRLATLNKSLNQSDVPNYQYWNKMNKESDINCVLFFFRRWMGMVVFSIYLGVLFPSWNIYQTHCVIGCSNFECSLIISWRGDGLEM